MRQPQQNTECLSRAELPERYEIGVDADGLYGWEVDFEPYLFNRAGHLVTQRLKNLVSFRVKDSEKKRFAALLHLDHNGTEALSLPSAPWGGVQAAPGFPVTGLITLLRAVEQWCIEHHLHHLVIKTAPAAYDEQQWADVKAAYEHCNFTVLCAQINHHIRINSTFFIDRIHPSERRRLRKCLRAGFTAEIWENPDPVQVYAFLVESRRRQGYPLSLDFDQLRLLLTQLPSHVQVFVVKDGNQIVSLTVGIRVSSEILYNFCPADNLDYRSYSPMVMLNCFLYEYAQNSGVQLIDLGVSLDHLGNEKDSLMRFKENLGAERSEKVTFEKLFPQISRQLPGR